MDSLSDEVLIEAYIVAKQNHLSQDFIAVFEAELKMRNLDGVIEH